MEEQLIEFVRNNQFLFNKKNKNYKNARLREQKYEELSKKLNVPAKRLKDRWRTLKDKFYKERKKELHSGSELHSSRKWKWMDHLSFLKDVNTEHSKHGTTGDIEKVDFIEISLDSTTDEQNSYSDSFEVNLLESLSMPVSSQRVSTSNNKAAKRNEIDKIILEAKTDFHEMTQLTKDVLRELRSQAKTSIQLFCNGLARQMEEANLSPYQLSSLQIALLKTFQEFLPKQ